MNDENLIPFNKRTKSEVRELAIRGGIASGKVRRSRKTFRESLKEALECEIPKDSPIYAKTRGQMRALGMTGEPTVQHIPVMGMIMKAANNPLAFAEVRDTLGEQPVQQYADLTPDAPFELGLMPADKVAKGQADHDARQLKNNKKE